MSRSLIREFGVRGYRRVLVLQEAPGRFLVERYVDGKPRRRRFSARAVAITWARQWYEAGAAPAADLTVREVFDRYRTAVSAQRQWRGSTLFGFDQDRKRLEEVLGPETRANSLTLASMDALWAAFTALGMAENQRRRKVKLLQRVFTWAQAREFVAHNKPALWDVPETRALAPTEYRAEETERLLRTWDPTSSRTWRPWVFVLLASSHGFRANAIRHLRWEDVDLAAGTIRLRAEWDKTRREWVRPLTWEGLSALLTARWHAERAGGGIWVLPGRNGRPWGYQALAAALWKAEKLAGIPHERYRGAHGFRRQAVGDVREATGDAALAMLWIGDRDLRQAKSYVREREEELQQVADRREPS